MRIGAVAAALVLVLAPAARAAPEDTANKISENIMSPFCPGVTLHDCPSQQADDLRERIRRWAAAGASEDRIMERLVAEYGEEVRAIPPGDGGGFTAWLVPTLVALGGAAFAATLARRWTKARERDREREDLKARRALREATPEQRERLKAELVAQEAQMLGGVDGGGLQT